MARLLFIIFTLIATLAQANTFDYSPKARLVYNKIMSLEFDEARQHIQQLKKDEPNNLIVHHLENYIDFFTVYINEDKNEFYQLESKKEARISAIQKGDTSSPYYLYLQADIRLQWALVRLKFGEYANSLFEVNKAFKLLNRNTSKFPNFIANKKDLGMLHAMMSIIPDNYKTIVRWTTSLDGTFEQGRQELEEVLHYAQHNDFVFEIETYVFYAYVMMYFGNESQAAWEAVSTSKLQNQTDPMSTFVLATVAMRVGKNDQAIRVLEARSKHPRYFSYPYLDFLLGQAKLRRLDADADIPLLRYVNQFNGRNYVKESYRLLAWHELTRNNPTGYRNYIKKAITEGAAYLDNDKSAMKEANAGEAPNSIVLKGRLLFDGGYYQRAYQTLSQASIADMQSTKARLGYIYFLGRASHLLKDYDQALQYYQQTIEQGKNESWYFACRSALEIGMIYETNARYKAAKTAFQNCLDIRPSEHRFGLHQKAKAGLARMRQHLQ